MRDANNAIFAVASYNFGHLIRWLRFLLHLIILALLVAAPTCASAKSKSLQSTT